MGSDQVKKVDLRVSAVEGNVSTISTSKFYSQNPGNDFNGVWVTLPTQREVEIYISGDLQQIRDLVSGRDIICDVMKELGEYFSLSR